MSILDSEYGFPVKPEHPGKPALQKMSEALVAQECHAEWHKEHPGEPCPPEMFNNDNWENIERGISLLRFGGGGIVEPGDAFVFGKEK